MDTDDVSHLERWRLVDEEPSSNYKFVEEAVELSGAEVDRLIEKGYAVKYESWQDVIEALGEVLVSKLACIVKTREDGTLKVRNVLDLRWSGYNDGGSTEGTHRTAEGKRFGRRCLRSEALRWEQ